MPNAIVDLTPIANALITLCALIMTGFFIPWLRRHIDAQKMDELQRYVTMGVSAAEQIYTGSGSGTQKYSYVEQFLKDKGYKIDSTQLRAMIESAVYQLSGSLGTGTDSGDTETGVTV